MRDKRTPEQVLQWAEDKKLEVELAGKIGFLKVALRGLLIAGAKSFTHMVIALERYDDLLTNLLSQTREEVSWMGRFWITLEMACVSFHI